MTIRVRAHQATTGLRGLPFPRYRFALEIVAWPAWPRTEASKPFTSGRWDDILERESVNHVPGVVPMAFLAIYKGGKEVAKTLVDDELEAAIEQRLDRSEAKLYLNGGYPVARLRSRPDKKSIVPLHHIVFEVAGYPVRRGQMIDHMNQDLLDNRIANLRIVDASERQANSPKHRDNVTGFKGVSKNGRGRFKAAVGKQGKNCYIWNL